MENNIENQTHIKEAYLDRASNLLKISMATFIFSFITYLIALLYGAFDFGLIFEIISFVFLLLAFFRIKNEDTQAVKTYLIISMIPVGWLIIYDLINLLANLPEVMTEVFYYFASLDFLFYNLNDVKKRAKRSSFYFKAKSAPEAHPSWPASSAPRPHPWPAYHDTAPHRRSGRWASPRSHSPPAGGRFRQRSSPPPRRLPPAWSLLRSFPDR